MVACTSVARWLLALGLGIACCGCAGGVDLPRLFAGRRAVTVQRAPVPEFAPPLCIVEPPSPPKKPPSAVMGKPVGIPEPEDFILATPPLTARGPAEDTASFTGPAGSIAMLHRLAAQRYAETRAYVVRLHRREQINGKNRPEEVLLFKFRKEPWSVYFKWLDSAGKDREVVYVKGEHGNFIHLLTAAGDIPLLPVAGKYVKLAPNSALVRTASRHPITEAGVGFFIDRFGALAEEAERGDRQHGTLQYLGVMKRSEFSQPVEGVAQRIPPGSEAALPEGGARLWFFDVALRFPVLVITQDSQGQEVEYYCHEGFTFPGQLSEDDFDPEKLWRR
jgi:Protein of unknown function (DUF1571)